MYNLEGVRMHKEVTLEGSALRYGNSVHLGSVEQGDDGYYVWWPELQPGYLTSYILEEIATILRALNTTWDEEVRSQCGP